MTNNLLNSKRRRTSSQVSQEKDEPYQPTRTEIERDYDRILFSTPTRRLADKTQVFPLEKNDSVRTRLTHSHEVSCLARSFGTALVFSVNDNIFSKFDTAKRDVPALLGQVQNLL